MEKFGPRIRDKHHGSATLDFYFYPSLQPFLLVLFAKKLALYLSHVGEPNRCSCVVRAVKDLLSGTQGNPLYEWKNVNVIRNKVNKSNMVLHVVLRIKAFFPSVDLNLTPS